MIGLPEADPRGATTRPPASAFSTRVRHAGLSMVAEPSSPEVTRVTEEQGVDRGLGEQWAARRQRAAVAVVQVLGLAVWFWWRGSPEVPHRGVPGRGVPGGHEADGVVGAQRRAGSRVGGADRGADTGLHPASADQRTRSAALADGPARRLGPRRARRPCLHPGRAPRPTLVTRERHTTPPLRPRHVHRAPAPDGQSRILRPHVGALRPLDLAADVPAGRPRRTATARLRSGSSCSPLWASSALPAACSGDGARTGSAAHPPPSQPSP